MIQYHSDMAYRPPMTPDIQAQRMREMSRYAPVGGEDVYASSLNLPAYKREADDALKNYQMKRNTAQRANVLDGLGMLESQRAEEQNMVGSLLGGLMRYV